VVEVLRDPHLHARGFLADQAGDAGPVALPNSPIRYEGSAMLALKPPPRLGEHTEAVLAELCDLEETELADIRRTGGIPS
jgi:crotonobetainyl-CoA:carnitine CoA-transferase CaiB-like acyl-CoA transferase